MARRRRGRPVHGWLVIDKPVGVTSTAVVAKARWAFDAQKAGHSGTLDPLADGVLAVALGEATKTVAALSDTPKTYRFTVRWGAATPSDDAETAPHAVSPLRPTEAQIEAALPTFTGDILQTPPQYSAVKLDGERAYDLARAGETLTLAPRPLHVHALRLAARPDADHAVFEMICGPGGYVRAIARDLGAALGCLGHVRALRRTATGPFTEAQAIPFAALDALRDDPAAEAHLLPLEAGLAALPEIPVSAEAAAHLRHGRAAEVAASLPWGAPAWASLDGSAVALGRVQGGRLQPDRVFLHALPEG